MKEKDFFYWFLNFGVLLGFLVIFYVLIDLTVVRGAYFRGLSLDNRIAESKIPAARGKIMDRKGRVIAESVYQYFKVVDGKRVYDDVGEFDGLKFEGNDLAFELRRKYPYGQSSAFVTGYVNKTGEDDLKKDSCVRSLLADDWLGRGGAEALFECKLRGEAGRRLVEVDAKREYLRELGRVDPVGGDDINLSVDAYWQEKVYELVKDQKVAVVISDVKTGQLLVMVSSPSFDPNIFSFSRNNQLILEMLSDDTNYPLLNRAIATRYHPGSVFKLVVATAGLEEKVIDGTSLIEDTGVITIGEYSYNNWLWTKRGAVDGMVDVVKGLQRSNDIFFYRLGERLGPDDIYKWAVKFGYDTESGLGFAGEVDSIVPNPDWKLETKEERWFLGNTYHLAIGQGDLAVNVAQVNKVTSAIANEGRLCQLTIEKGREECVNLPISKQNLEMVVEGMERACNEGGTAWPLFNFKTNIACKTGTAEVGDGSKDTHAWLTAFAPVEDPEIAITVMAERGGEGSDVAAPIVGDFFKMWFNEPDTKVPRYASDGKTVVYE